MDFLRLTPRRTAAGLLLAVACTSGHAADSTEPAFRALYRELVETNTTLSAGSCTLASERMAARLKAAGLPAADIQILGPADRPKEAALVATLRGRDPKAGTVLLLAHIDVVEAKRADWQRDPFTLVEENGFFYARGASDDKAMAAVLTDSLVRYLNEGFKPRRTLKLALTCGEETPDSFNSVRWLLKNQPDALKASFALNEGAGGELDADGRPTVLQIQAGEKVYQDFQLEITNSGGHSSQPVPDNAIYRLSAALTRIGAHRFPIAFVPATRGYFEWKVKHTDDPAQQSLLKDLLANPQDSAAGERLWLTSKAWNSALRTTCVATMLDAGHAPNALPQRARANINCRILPGVPPAEVQAALAQVIGDEGIAIQPVGEPATAAPLPPLTDAILDPVRKVAKTIWPTAALVPTMTTGATDGRFLNAAGIPTYGLSGMFHDAEGSHAHGLDERIRVQSLLDGRRFLHEVIKLYAMQPG